MSVAKATAIRDELALALARSMPGWNEDTTEPDITDEKLRSHAEAHWAAVNEECLRQGRELADIALRTLHIPYRALSVAQRISAAADAIARGRGYLHGACLDEHYRDARDALTAASAIPREEDH